MADMVLPDAEFDIMQIIWGEETPISSMRVYSLTLPEKNRKPQTVLTLLTRLEKRGFLSSEKRGKERFYTPLVSREAYLNQETGLFMRRFHKNSLMGLMSALFSDKKPKAEELLEIEQWLEQSRGEADERE